MWHAGIRQTIRSIRVLVALFLLVGCTSWTRPGASDAMMSAAAARCRAIAHRQIQAAMVTVMSDPGGYTQGKQDCMTVYGDTSCTKKPDSYRGPSYQTRDTNEDARDAVFENCMYGSGWTKS